MFADDTNAASTLGEPFPILDQQKFERHRKPQKPTDRGRILFSPNSEDWVTWTAFRLLDRDPGQRWWRDLVHLAQLDNPSLRLPAGWKETPDVMLWQPMPSPKSYEKQSRARMRNSGNQVWIERSDDPRPVEGESEIDIVLQNEALVIFIEAKLQSDISPRTTYDPDRNQLIRNIDCVLDQPPNRIPMVWMLVRDAAQNRAYTQLLNRYRHQPDELARGLVHRDPHRVMALAHNLSLVRWKDLLRNVVKVSPDDDHEISVIKTELARRI